MPAGDGRVVTSHHITSQVIQQAFIHSAEEVGEHPAWHWTRVEDGRTDELELVKPRHDC